MSKRKRLSPAPFGDPTGDIGDGGPLETKAMYPLGVAPAPTRRAPIADVAGSSAAMAALEEVTRNMQRARDDGRLAMALPLDAIRLDHLVRDRIPADDDDMAALVESLRARGQQMPVDVCDLGDGRYGLISGWRRCHALARLHTETGDARFATVLAVLRRPDQASDAYRAMVEENEVRAGLSHYERARIVVKAVEQGVFDTRKAALQGLFATASRAKRSKIGSFADIVAALDGTLRFPRALGERTGLKLAKGLSEDPDLAGRITGALDAADPGDAETEQALLERLTTPAKPARKAAIKPDKTRFQPRAGVDVEVHGDGRLVIRGAAVDAGLRDRILTFLARDG